MVSYITFHGTVRLFLAGALRQTKGKGGRPLPFITYRERRMRPAEGKEEGPFTGSDERGGGGGGDTSKVRRRRRKVHRISLAYTLCHTWYTKG